MKALKLAIWVSLSLAAASRTAALDRLAPPPELALKGAEKALEKMLRERPEKGVERAVYCLELTRKPEAGDTERLYVLYRAAALEAAKAGDARTAAEVIAVWRDRFDIDLGGETKKALEMAARTASGPGANRVLAGAYLELAEAALTAGQSGLAAEAAGQAAKWAKLGRSSVLASQGEKLASEAKRAKQSEGAADKGRLSLVAEPNKAELQLAVGRFEALVCGEWEAAIPRLARAKYLPGQDQALCLQAERDLGRPTTGLDRKLLADGWRVLAGKVKGLHRWRLEQRAVWWYEQALPLFPRQRRDEIQVELRKLSTRRVERLLAEAMLHLSLDEGAIRQTRPGFKDVRDNSGLGNHGAARGCVSAPGRSGGALSFNPETQDQIVGETAGDGFPAGSASRTLAAWVRTRRTQGQTRNVFTYGDNSREDGTCSLAIEHGSGGPGLFVGRTFVWASSKDVRDGEWHHIVGVYEGPTTNRVRVYVDGFEVKAEEAKTRVDTKLRDRWTVGRAPSGAFDGSVDEVLLFPRALTAEEVKLFFEFGTKSEPKSPENDPPRNRSPSPVSRSPQRRRRPQSYRRLHMPDRGASQTLVHPTMQRVAYARLDKGEPWGSIFCLGGASLRARSRSRISTQAGTRSWMAKRPTFLGREGLEWRSNRIALSTQHTNEGLCVPGPHLRGGCRVQQDRETAGRQNLEGVPS